MPGAYSHWYVPCPQGIFEVKGNDHYKTIGMKKQFPTFIDETAQLFDTINISGGSVGLQIELSPDDLAKLVNAAFCDLF